MNVSSIVRRLILAAGVVLTVAGIAVASVGAQQPADPTISTPGQTSIVTDKESYAVGEPITITYTLPGPGRYRITDRQGGQVSTLRAGVSAQATGRIQGTVTPPVGTECLTLEYTDGKNRTSTAETCFQVTDTADTGQQKLTPGLYTLRHRRAGLMLRSTIAKTVYLSDDDGDLQKWVLETAPDGYVFLRNLATGYYLEVNPTTDQVCATQVCTNEKNLGIFQQWKVRPGREGSLLLIHRAIGAKLTADLQGRISIDNEGPSILDGYEWTLTAVQP